MLKTVGFGAFSCPNRAEHVSLSPCLFQCWQPSALWGSEFHGQGQAQAAPCPYTGHECYLQMKSDWKGLVNQVCDPCPFQCILMAVTPVSVPEAGQELDPCFPLFASHTPNHCCHRLALNIRASRS